MGETSAVEDLIGLSALRSSRPRCRAGKFEVHELPSFALFLEETRKKTVTSLSAPSARCPGGTRCGHLATNCRRGAKRGILTCNSAAKQRTTGTDSNFRPLVAHFHSSFASPRIVKARNRRLLRPPNETGTNRARIADGWLIAVCSPLHLGSFGCRSPELAKAAKSGPNFEAQSRDRAHNAKTVFVNCQENFMAERGRTEQAWVGFWKCFNQALERNGGAQRPFAPEARALVRRAPEPQRV